MQFIDNSHKAFLYESLQRSGSTDQWHQALFYTLGLPETTRQIIDSLYDFKTGCIKPEGVLNPAQTGTSMKVTRLAFNLYTDGCPSNECTDMILYLPTELFCCSLLPWMIEAVKIRYPEYC